MINEIETKLTDANKAVKEANKAKQALLKQLKNEKKQNNIAKQSKIMAESMSKLFVQSQLATLYLSQFSDFDKAIAFLFGRVVEMMEEGNHSKYCLIRRERLNKLLELEKSNERK